MSTSNANVAAPTFGSILRAKTAISWNQSARSSALRAADGVVADYIRSLAKGAARPVAGRATPAESGLAVAHAYRCGASRVSGLAARRRPGLRRVPAPA